MSRLYCDWLARVGSGGGFDFVAAAYVASAFAGDLA
jgi:hypothetical protein